MEKFVDDREIKPKQMHESIEKNRNIFVFYYKYCSQFSHRRRQKSHIEHMDRGKTRFLMKKKKILSRKNLSIIPNAY